jgi:hypothetical protein
VRNRAERGQEAAQFAPVLFPSAIPHTCLNPICSPEATVHPLLSSCTPEMGLARVEKVRAGYPDCIAYSQGKRIRIEFEYRSRNFRVHKHRLRACDWIVCWIHDWPEKPKNLRVVELRKEYGLVFNVWLL